MAFPDRRPHGRAARLNEPRPVQVQVDAAGDPVAVRRDRPTWTPVSVQERWRIDDEWWRAHPIERHYFELVLANGGVLRVYRDGVTDEWFTH